MSEETADEIRARLAKNVKDKEAALDLARKMGDIGVVRVKRKIPKASSALDEARRKLAEYDAKVGTS